MINLILGILCILYGLFMLVLRLTNHLSIFGKLSAMKEKFGEKTGTIIHIIGYTVVPLALGIVLLLKFFI